MRALVLALVAVVAAAGVRAAERSLLIDAAKNADVDGVRALVAKKVDVNVAEPDGTTPLHWASHRDDLESADALLTAGARVNAATDLGVTPLWSACLNGSDAMVRRLLQAGANPNAALLRGETPIMVAARAGKAAIVAQLVAAGADVNAHGVRGQTALMWAVAQKHAAVVKVLLAHGADVHARSDAWSEVMAVPPHGHLDYNRAIPHGGDTALMFAARVGDLESAKLLVAANANVDDTDAWGVSATALAAHAGFRDVMATLLDRGADPNAARAGFSALHAAIMRRDPAMVRLLLEHGADPDAPLRQWTPTRRSSKDFHFSPELVGAAPLWLAARFGGPDVMQLLLDYGADPFFVHHGDRVVEGRGGSGFQHRRDVTTTVMAAVGMGGGEAWLPPAREQREQLMLTAVEMLVDRGVDINAANLDGRTALDGATALKYETVVAFLRGKGARTGAK
jgi:ankyrin repeat protein